MAGGAPSPASAAIAQAARAARSQESVDATAIPPRTIEQFTTGRINLVQTDEERDESGKVTQAATVGLHLREAGIFALAPTPDGDMAVVPVGGIERQTTLIPELAINLGEGLIEHGKAAQDTMKEQPLAQNGKVIPATPADIAPVAAAAAETAGLKGA